MECGVVGQDGAGWSGVRRGRIRWSVSLSTRGQNKKYSSRIEGKTQMDSRVHVI